MAKLSSEDLSKPFYGAMANDYPNRASKFLAKMSAKEPFKMVKGGKAVVLGNATPDSDFIDKIERIAGGEYGISFTPNDKVAVRYEDGSESVVGITGFEKTPEDFGGGTKEKNQLVDSEESLICSALNFVFRQGKPIEIADLHSITYKEYVADALSPDWQNTLILTANIVFHSNDFKVEDPQFVKGGTSFESDRLKALQKVFNRVISKGEISWSKWNPADVWAISSKFNPSVLGKIETLAGLNSWMMDNQNLIQGISLKKLGKSPKVDLIIPVSGESNEAAGFVARFSFGALILDWDHEIMHGIRAMKFRCFNGTRNFEGELQGTYAQGGKISQGSINGYIETNANGNAAEYKLPSCVDLEKDLSDPGSRRYEKLLNMAEEFGIGRETVNGYKLNQKINLYQGCKIQSFLSTLNKEEANRFISDLVNHAASRSPKSCVYLKVS